MLHCIILLRLLFQELGDTHILTVCPGVCWKSLPGGGFLVSKSWSFTDASSLYLYPDCRTALLGSFSGSRMLAAREAEVDYPLN